MATKSTVSTKRTPTKNTPSLKSQGAGYSTTNSKGVTTYYKSAKDASGYSDTKDGKGVSTSAGKPISQVDAMGNTITSASLKQNKPYVPPEKPQVTDPGNLALAGNAGIASILEPLGFTQNDNGQIGMGDILKFQQDNQPDLPNLENQYYGSKEYKDVKRAQREVTDYTSQLNSITANSQAQQLSLEGQGRGQTGAFVGGEQARINREAAIQALPIQAQLSASQGNLEFAQKQLDTVFTLRSQDAQNKFKLESDRLNSIVSFLNQAETRQYNARLQGEERTYNQTQNNINYLRQLSAQAREYGNTSVLGQLGSQDPASPTFEQDVAFISKGIRKPVSAVKRDTQVVDGQLIDMQTGEVISNIGDGFRKVKDAEIKDLSDTWTAKNSVLSLVDSLQENIRNSGTQNLFGKTAGQRTGDTTNLLLAIKNLEKTGALDAGTIKVLEGTIPSSKFFATESAQIAALDSIKNTIESKVNEYVGSYRGTSAETDPRTQRIYGSSNSTKPSGTIMLQDYQDVRGLLNSEFDYSQFY